MINRLLFLYRKYMNYHKKMKFNIIFNFYQCIKNFFIKIKQFFIENWEEILYSIFIVLIYISSILILEFVLKYSYFLSIINLKKEIVKNFSLDPFAVIDEVFFPNNLISFYSETWYRYLDWPIDRLISAIPNSLRSQDLVFSLWEGWRTADLVGKIVIKLYIINLITKGQITPETYDFFINQMIITLKTLGKDGSSYMLSTPQNFSGIYDFSHSENLYVIHKNFLKSLLPLEESVSVHDINKIENFFLNEKSYSFIFSMPPSEFSNFILTLSNKKIESSTYIEFFFNNFYYIINLISDIFS